MHDLQLDGYMRRAKIHWCRIVHQCIVCDLKGKFAHFSKRHFLSAIEKPVTVVKKKVCF